MRYLITYQLEDQAPETISLSAREGEQITKLKQLILEEQIELGLEEEDAEALTDTLSILEEKKEI